MFDQKIFTNEEKRFFSTGPLGTVLYFGSVLNRPEEFKVTHKGVFSSVRITCHLCDKDCKKESSFSSINTWAVLILCLCPREENRRLHSATGKVPYVPERKKQIVSVVE
jgi:hypothetical protein